jgi:signal transduction histidine kinase
LQKAASLQDKIRGAAALALVANVLDTVEEAVFVCERAGRILLANSRAQQSLQKKGLAVNTLNLFGDLLHRDAGAVLRQLESGESEILLPIESSGGSARARLRWLPDPDWVIVNVEDSVSGPAGEDSEIQRTLQGLLQEREVTYRNLLAAYLRLQEVNRQKTVFLASAAHELKTPLAVMKGYYDLLLCGSLGRLSDKHREILQESKESCERLVRLVSMFLNYSALESGKLALHIHENDLQECIGELANRWQEAFRQKGVRFEVRLEGTIPPFKFDYQKVQQCVAALLDNALKHTRSGGAVIMCTEPHFWERRIAASSPSPERRRENGQVPNSALVSVTDGGPGIAAEYHRKSLKILCASITPLRAWAWA